MILIHVPTYQCFKCYGLLSLEIVRENPNINDPANDWLIIRHGTLAEVGSCQDNGKETKVPLRNFLVSLPQ